MPVYPGAPTWRFTASISTIKAKIPCLEQTMRSHRPFIATVAALSQSLVASGIVFVWLAFAFWGTSRLFALLFASVYWGLPLVVSVLAAKGLWRGEKAGWWTAVLFNLAGLAVGSWLEVFPPRWKAVVVIVFLIPSVLLLLPPVRRFYGIPAQE
jgi:hypothetical protein